MIEDGDCCDHEATDENGDHYAGHICLECHYQHCHCPDGTPGPLPLDTEGLWTVSKRMGTPDMSGGHKWAVVTVPASYKDTLAKVGNILSLQPDSQLSVRAHICKYPQRCCTPCKMHKNPHQGCIMR